MVEQELLHLIHLQKMNRLISFTGEIEENINQERDNFQGLFYYLDLKQSNSIRRSEESVPCVFLPCTLRFMLGPELPAGVCSRLVGLLWEHLVSCPKRAATWPFLNSRWHVAGQLHNSSVPFWARCSGRKEIASLPSQISFLRGRQGNKCLDVHELLVFLNCFLKDCCCDSQEWG